MKAAPREVVIHGHFYQPPREDPWLELVPRESSAAPDHDWNERISRECYAPLAKARVLDELGRLRRTVNAYAWCSFDIGSTLFRWFDGHAPAVADAIVAGDRAARERLGFGNALAQPYHHLIMPLATRRDKITEVRWGIRDFRRRFGREPEGMWLPETAVDHETLEVLAQEGIRFTVLAPHQVASAPRFGRPGRWHHGAHELAIFCYDAALASDIAFGDTLRDAKGWYARLVEPPRADKGVTISSVATDGETFGHHHRYGDLALAALIDRLEKDPAARLNNFAALLAAHPPVDDVTLVERTAWSCPHSLGRWQDDCGCRMDPATSQAWRAPLRTGLNQLADSVHAVVEAEWPADAGDVWLVRDEVGPELTEVGQLPGAARRLLEAERHALKMFTSCGWFFDDLARVEPPILLRHAARAIEWLPDHVHVALEAALLKIIGPARSNDPAKGDGFAIWQREVVSQANGAARLAAGIAALRDVTPDALDDLVMPAHDWRLEGDEIITIHRRTGGEMRWQAECAISGVVPLRIQVRRPWQPDLPADQIAIAEVPTTVRALLLLAARPMVFDAALDGSHRELLRDGLLTPDGARLAALDGAWRLVARDGVEDAGVVVHAVLDLFDLEEAPLPDEARITALERLGPLPPSTMRDSLAARFSLALPGTA